MKEDLSRLTNAELKKYISVHRNENEKASAALAIILSRQDPDSFYPYSFGMNGSEAELKAVFEQKFEEIKQQRLNKTGNVDE